MKTKARILDFLTNYFEENANRFRLEMAFLYGSWAGGIPRSDSDIDIALLFSEELAADDELFDRVTGISVDLSKVFSAEVNVITIYPDFRHPMLYYNAVVNSIPVYVRKFDQYISLKLEAIHQMEDFSIFGREWQLNTSRKNMEALKHARLSVL